MRAADVSAASVKHRQQGKAGSAGQPPMPVLPGAD